MSTCYSPQITGTSLGRIRVGVRGGMTSSNVKTTGDTAAKLAR